MKEDLNKAKLDATRKANLLASLKKDRDALHAANQALLKQKDLLEKKLERALNDSKAKVLPLRRPPAFVVVGVFCWATSSCLGPAVGAAS